jgi:Xaa-Pro aminopeptidase
MAAAGLDALLIHGTNDYLGGYVRWFSDIPATTGYPTTIVFPAVGDMRIVSQGRFGLDAPPPPNSPYRGVGRLIGAPGYASAHYTARYEGEAVAKALADFPGAAIGLVGTTLPARLFDHLRAACPRARFEDASDLVDAIKAVKSAEEIALIRRAAEMQDRCIAAVRDRIAPGMTDLEVTAIAEQAGRSMGSEQGIFLAASAPPGQSALYGIRRYQNRRIEAGDQISLLIENSGPGGYYTEIGRTFVLGRADPALRDAMAFVVALQDETIAAVAGGDGVDAVWARHNARLVGTGHAAEARLYCHGQGYDLVERPLIRFDEPMAPAPGMNIACHPTIAEPDLFMSCCDNFLLTDTGAERLHATPRTLIEIA